MVLKWWPIRVHKRRRWPLDSTFEWLRVQQGFGPENQPVFAHAWRLGPVQISFGFRRR